MLATLLADYGSAIGIGISVLLNIGLATGWIISTVKKADEIKNLRVERDRIHAEKNKLEAEAVDVAGRTLDNKLAAKAAYRDACKAVVKHAGILHKAIRDASDEVFDLRKNVCAAVTDVIDSFQDYCERSKLEYRHQPNEMELFVLKVTCPELDRIASWVRICNNTKFLEQYGCEPLAISGSTVHTFEMLGTHLTESRKADVSKQVAQSIQRLLHAHESSKE